MKYNEAADLHFHRHGSYMHYNAKEVGCRASQFTLLISWRSLASVFFYLLGLYKRICYSQSERPPRVDVEALTVRPMTIFFAVPTYGGSRKKSSTPRLSRQGLG